MLAEQMGHGQVVKLLVAAGADVHVEKEVSVQICFYCFLVLLILFDYLCATACRAL
jgi:hypothetical protein